MKIIYQKPTCTSICVLNSNHLPTMIFRLSFFYYSTMVIFFFQNVFFQQRALFNKVIKNKFNQHFTTLQTLIPFIVQELMFQRIILYFLPCKVEHVYVWMRGWGGGIQMINIPKCTGRPNSIL